MSPPWECGKVVPWVGGLELADEVDMDLLWVGFATQP